MEDGIPIFKDMSPYDEMGNKKTFPNARLLINDRRSLNSFLDSMEAKSVLTYPFNIEYQLKDETEGGTEKRKYALYLRVVKIVNVFKQLSGKL
jgi:hypothetical protein